MVGILAIKRISQPLIGLRQAIQAWGGVDFQRQLVAVAGGDEIGYLARDFQEMGVRLGQILAILEAVGRQWERTFDSVPDPVFLLDGDFRIRRLNLAAPRPSGPGAGAGRVANLLPAPARQQRATRLLPLPLNYADRPRGPGRGGLAPFGRPVRTEHQTSGGR